MTAEQLLIEENKKDPRVRYITTHNTWIDFWSEKPFFNGVLWIGVMGSLIKSNNHLVDFGNRDSLIICIDDITPEVPPIPEKWYLPINEKTIDFINEARAKINKRLSVTSKLNTLDFDIVRNVDNEIMGFNALFNGNCQEITLEQFKKFVLKSEENQEEIQDPNDSLDSIDSYEKSGSIGSVEFSGKYIKTGRIESLDFNGNPFQIPTNNNTFEFYSIRCWVEDRINYINQFIKRNIDSDLCINPEWISERNELIEKLKNL